MAIDDFMMDSCYNRQGPETCLSDDEFVYFWNYFKTNLLPNFYTSYILKEVLGLPSEGRLPSMALLTNKETVLDYLDSGNHITPKDLLGYARDGIIFCCNHWIAARFYNYFGTIYEQFPYCFEDIKYLIKKLAKEQCLL